MRAIIVSTIALLALTIQVNAGINLFNGPCSNVQSITYEPSMSSGTTFKVTQADWIFALANVVMTWFGQTSFQCTSIHSGSLGNSAVYAAAFSGPNTEPFNMRVIGYDSITQTAVVYVCLDSATLGYHIDASNSLDATTKTTYKTLFNILLYFVNFDGLMIWSDANTMTASMA